MKVQSTYFRCAIHSFLTLLLVSACSKKVSKSIADTEPRQLEHHRTKLKKPKQIDVEDCVELGKSFSKKKGKLPKAKPVKTKNEETKKVKKKREGFKIFFYIALALAGLAVSIAVIISFSTTLALTFSLLLLWVLIGFIFSSVILIGFTFFLAFQALMNIGN